MDLSKRCVIVSAVSAICLEELETYFSRFGNVDNVHGYRDNAVFVVFEDAVSVASAVQCTELSFMENMWLISVPSELELDELYAILGDSGQHGVRRLNPSDEHNAPDVGHARRHGVHRSSDEHSALDDVQRKVRHCVEGLAPADLLAVLEPLVRDMEEFLPSRSASRKETSNIPPSTRVTPDGIPARVTTSAYNTYPPLGATGAVPKSNRFEPRTISVEHGTPPLSVSHVDRFTPASHRLDRIFPLDMPTTKDEDRQLPYHRQTSTPFAAPSLRTPSQPQITPPPGFAPFQSLQYPKIIFFSGDQGKDASYLQWRNEVKCLMNEGHPASNICQGIRRSLKGTAADVLLNLGEDATPQKIVTKFDVIFGDALTSEALLEEYYTARQKENEHAAVWGCRLETILNKVLRRGYLSSNITEMLRTKFWSGLRDDRVKNAIRHKFDANQDFESLLRAARSVELEGIGKEQLDAPKPKVTPQTVKMNVQQTPTLESRFEDLLREMSAMRSELRDLCQREPTPQMDDKAQLRQRLRSTGSCFYCHEPGHFIADCTKRPPRPSSQQQPTASGNGQ